MNTHNTAAYGSWKSPITSDSIVRETIALSQPSFDKEDIYWIEMRPGEGGRNVIVKCSFAGEQSDITPAGFNARTKVHEYGGGDFLVHEGVVYFSNFSDQRLYAQSPGQMPQALTDEQDCRYADAVMDWRFNRLICVREDHRNKESGVVNSIISIGLDTDHEARTLISGNDFYASPRISPDGRAIAWLTWNHSNMPWDGTELWTAGIDEQGVLKDAKCVAGGPDESVFQPEFSSEGELFFVSDMKGWWNLYKFQDSSVSPIIEMPAEFGMPQWVFGMSTYAFCGKEKIICAFNQKGIWKLAQVHVKDKTLHIIKTPYSDIGYLRANEKVIAFIGGAPDQFRSIVRFDPQTQKTDVLKSSNNIRIDAAYLSKPEAIDFSTGNNALAHAFYYPPRNMDFSAPGDEKPPLLVMSHGGPTAAASNVLNLGIQYWTSRGFAVVDVNYRGSTGYGRQYRQELKYNWGIFDVEDCISAACFLIKKGLVNENNVAIRGGSAGGYTTLRALTSSCVFKAGASYYGVSDLEALALETHKFESHYLDGLIGEYPAQSLVYKQRSPINNLDQLSCPVIFFQGLDDKVVPPEQAQMMLDMLKEKGLPVAYVPFEGEGHGFRSADNIKRALDGELYFYSRVFGFDPADKLEPVFIDNLF